MELVSSTGLPSDKVRALLAGLKAQGRLIVGRRHRENLAGHPSPVPVYRVKP